jgi:beta-glucanase (GH16 family)
VPAFSRLLPKLLWVWGGLLLTFAACEPVVTPTPTPTTTPTPVWERAGWVLVWQDEFDGDVLDPAQWTYDLGGGGWGNNELEYYTNRPENARLENGFLILEARAEKYLYRNYTSARLKTQGLHTWTYGRFEARMRLPHGQGIWPAFWLLGEDINRSGWPACGEIDIMEYIGRQPDRVFGTVHGPGYSGGAGVGSAYIFPAGLPSDDFHVYAIEWEPQEIRWYVDETQYFAVTPAMLPGKWVYDHPFFLILNLAVGGNWPGAPDETTSFPQSLQVDYVRVYQRPDMASQSTCTVHVASIEVSAQDNPDGTWQAVASVTIVDEQGQPVEGAKVTGGWAGAILRGEREAWTDASGVARLVSWAISRPGEETFCVSAVAHSRYSYDPSADARSCGRVTH